jgi:hypothetical protein
MALPVNAGYQARIDLALQGIAGLPGIFNPERRSLAYNTAAGLNEAGLTRDLQVEQVDEGGNLVYGLVRGADGKLYSQAHREISDVHGDRGTYYSSLNVRDQRDARQELDARRNAAFRGFGERQSAITSEQAERERGLRGDLATGRGDYAQWQAEQNAPTPAAPAAAPGGGPGSIISF